MHQTDSGSVLLVPEAWGELVQTLNGEWERNRGNRQTIGCVPRMGVGDGFPVPFSSQGTGKESFEVGLSGTISNCWWDTQFSVPRFRPDLRLSLSLQHFILYSCLLFLPFLSHHTSEQKRTMIDWPNGNWQGQCGLQEMGSDVVGPVET